MKQVKPRDNVGVLGYPSNYRVGRNGDRSTAQTVFCFIRFAVHVDLVLLEYKNCRFLSMISRYTCTLMMYTDMFSVYKYNSVKCKYRRVQRIPYRSINSGTSIPSMGSCAACSYIILDEITR